MQRTLFIFFIFILNGAISSTQANSIVDSIEQKLLYKIELEKNIKNQIDNYFSIIQFYQKNNLEKSISYCDMAIKYCKTNEIDNMIPEFLIEKCKTYIYLGEFNTVSQIIFEIENQLQNCTDDNLWGNFYLLKNLAFLNAADFAQSMDNGLKAISFFNRSQNSLGLTKAFNNIGNIYSATNNNQKALEFYLKSKKYANSTNNKELISTLDNNIGVVYDQLNDYDKALEYYFKSLEYNNQSGNLASTTVSFTNIAALLAKLNRNNEAMAYYKKALYLTKHTKNQVDKALIYYNIGELLFKQNKFDSANYNLNMALKLYIGSNDLYSVTETYNLLAKLNIESNHYPKANHYIKKALGLSKSSDFLVLRETSYRLLSELYSKQSKFELAFNYQKEATLISDSILNNYKQKAAQYSDFQIEFQNQSGKFEKDLQLHDEHYEAELDQERKEKYIYALLLLLFLGVAFILLRNFTRSSKINKTLVQKNREVEDQKELIEISNIELREQYSFTETLLNTIPNPVFYTDKKSHLLGCNKAFEDISGLPVDDIIGLKTSQINFDFDILCHSSKIKNVESDELIRNEGLLKFADGLEHDVICFRKGIVDPNKNLVGVLGIIIDITEIRKTEKQLKLSQTRLKEAINAKDKFFNIMAHDLKNPFNAILGLTSFIADDFGTHTKEELKEYVGLINQSSTKVYNLLENILEWARAQSGSIESNPTSFIINEVVQECSTLFAQSCEQKNIALNININKEYEVIADKNMILAIIRNLLSNAIKYTPKGGKIIIDAQNGSNNDLLVSIIDNGIGIPEKNLERLFKIDQPVSTPGVDNERGTGLGLIICKEFVKQNGGSLKVSSEPNKGSTFTFSLPSGVQ